MNLVVHLIARTDDGHERIEATYMREGNYRPDHQKQVFTIVAADPRLPFEFDLRLDGKSMAYLADTACLTPDVRELMGQVIQDALDQLEG